DDRADDDGAGEKGTEGPFERRSVRFIVHGATSLPGPQGGSERRNVGTTEPKASARSGVVCGSGPCMRLESSHFLLELIDPLANRTQGQLANVLTLARTLQRLREKLFEIAEF